ncbi:Hypothetical protein NTJ_02672 [Nesidiocoris tenuis]|uniref:Uncharacterized protein n=1 Tax=Nesidiocoris tenuis TaxID=355587 RepID=A0ABN7AG89_9HEMI|nr:Hypothetical protein NTJ_02672 [Nesidiocoris tenuis]
MVGEGENRRKEPSFVSTAEFGLSAAHSPMLEGIRYPPDLKSSVASSLGPLTLLIMYYRSTTQAQPDKYSKRWISAIKDTYAHLPFLKKLLHTLWNANARDASSIIGAVGDLTLLIRS